MPGLTAFFRDKKATIYDWNPELGNEEIPNDFYLHEFLHCAFRQLLSADKRKVKELMILEEMLIQDICKIFRKAINIKGAK